MDVTPLIKENAQVIQSYRGGQFRVSGVVYDGAVIVTPSSTVDWAFQGEDISDLSEDDFAPLIAQVQEIDVVLLGTGARIAFLKPFLKQALKDKGLNVDVMDTGAACRTYNVLMAEGRRVAAALLAF